MKKDVLTAALVNAVIIGLAGYAVQAFLLKAEPSAALMFALMIGAAAGAGYYIGRMKPKK